MKRAAAGLNRPLDWRGWVICQKLHVTANGSGAGVFLLQFGGIMRVEHRRRWN